MGKRPHILPLLQNGIPPTGDNPSEQTALVRVPYGVTSPANKSAPGALLSPLGPLSYKKPASAWDFHGSIAFFEHPHDLAWGPTWACGFVFHCRLPLAGGTQLPNPRLHHGLHGNLSSGTWKFSDPSYSTDVIFRDLFFTHSQPFILWLQLLWCRVFSTFLNIKPQRCYHCQPWPVAGLSWSQLALTLSDRQEASSSFSQRTL